MTIYVIHWLAKEINGDYISSMIEFASENKQQAEQHFIEHAPKDNMMNVDHHMCAIYRQIVPVELNTTYQF